MEGICEAENGIFSKKYLPAGREKESGNIDRIKNAAPEMKTITLDRRGEPVIED